MQGPKEKDKMIEVINDLTHSDLFIESPDGDIAFLNDLDIEIKNRKAWLK